MGLGYQRQSGSLFAGAFLKRHAGFGPGGSGAIYRLDRGGDGSFGTGDDAVSTFLDLEALAPGAAGADPHPSGVDPDYFHDIAAFDLIGKRALGDVEIADDGTTLYTVGLNSRRLYSIPVGNPPTTPGAGAVQSFAVPDPARPASPTRPRRRVS